MSTATGLMSRGICVHRMYNNDVFDGCKVIREQIVGLTGLREFVHIDGGGLDQCGEMRKRLFLIRSDLMIFLLD